MYIPRYFKIEELLPKYFYEKYKDLGNKLFLMFDERALVTLDRLRNRFGSAIVNNWIFGGNNHYRGWRPFDLPFGSLLSQHKFGRAFDVTFKNYSSEKVRIEIINDSKKERYFEHIVCIEDKISWLHFDCRNWISSELLIVNP